MDKALERIIRQGLKATSAARPDWLAQTERAVRVGRQVRRAANLLIGRHGDGAAREAARHARAMFADGDMAEYAMWQRIAKAVERIG